MWQSITATAISPRREALASANAEQPAFIALPPNGSHGRNSTEWYDATMARTPAAEFVSQASWLRTGTGSTLRPFELRGTTSVQTSWASKATGGQLAGRSVFTRQNGNKDKAFLHRLRYGCDQRINRVYEEFFESEFATFGSTRHRS
jgi:hypothetical protein